MSATAGPHPDRTEPAFPPRTVPSAVPDRDTTRELVAALDVRRNAAIGFGGGLALAAVAYAFRVFELAGPNPDSRGSPALFVLLAFVLAVTVGLLLTAALTARSALRLARTAEPTDDEA